MPPEGQQPPLHSQGNPPTTHSTSTTSSLLASTTSTRPPYLAPRPTLSMHPMHAQLSSPLTSPTLPFPLGFHLGSVDGSPSSARPPFMGLSGNSGVAGGEGFSLNYDAYAAAMMFQAQQVALQAQAAGRPPHLAGASGSSTPMHPVMGWSNAYKPNVIWSQPISYSHPPQAAVNPLNNDPVKTNASTRKGRPSKKRGSFIDPDQIDPDTAEDVALDSVQAGRLSGEKFSDKKRIHDLKKLLEKESIQDQFCMDPSMTENDQLDLIRYMLRLYQRQIQIQEQSSSPVQKSEKLTTKRKRQFDVIDQRILRTLQDRFRQRLIHDRKRRRQLDAKEALFMGYCSSTALYNQPIPTAWFEDRREEVIEERRAAVWSAITTEQIPIVHQAWQEFSPIHKANAKFIAEQCATEKKRRWSRVAKPIATATVRARKATREVILYWKRNEKEEREVRKRAEKEAMEKLKQEQEEREQRRQARKLHFLISQTELFSHFVSKKLGTGSSSSDKLVTIANRSSAVTATSAVDTSTIDFDTAEDGDLERLAEQNAASALASQRERTRAFDQRRAEASTSDAAALDLTNPTELPGALEVKQPSMLTCQLKPYQLKGLHWLANLYTQGLNGILADDMGLGKTVQSVSLMAWLAETQNIWGPFLVIAPASTLHNWQQEITKFAPQLIPLPYWGVAKDRKTLRKFWTSKKLYSKEAPFHVLITSYQLVIVDQQYFQRVKWQYMILDEAHAIKSANTTRWKTLLGFNCRNRLLLTGTPIQNSMQELWALLHFIMPTLFDSHEEFSEWFSKDIESHAEKKGSLNEHQLRRLHMILKPFMLRRVKKDVEHELGQKIEKTIYCPLTARQKRMYQALSEKISIDELLEKATFQGKDDDADNLMNVVVHFRKVCNHPQLFEIAEVKSPVSFFDCSQPPFVLSNREPDLINVPYSVHNPITYHIPKLVYKEAMLDTCSESNSYGSRNNILYHLMNIFRTDFSCDNPSFGFCSLSDTSLAEMEKIHRQKSIIRLLDLPTRRSKCTEKQPSETFSKLCSVCNDPEVLSRLSVLPSAFQPSIEASPIEIQCSDRGFAYRQASERFDRQWSALLFGLPRLLPPSPERKRIAELSNYEPFFGPLLPRNHTFSQIWVPDAKRLLFESGKLQELDRLLAQLKAEGHRVLIFFQMTKMIDLVEEYLSYRQYTYLRLDGSSKIADRRDMVIDWQTNEEIFVFLLSTRAGGLGINLTAADTDWNPTMDQQAMDRAHRLGQVRQVTVYRLITRNTIEERILQRAMQKDEIQKVVISDSAFAQQEEVAE